MKKAMRKVKKYARRLKKNMPANTGGGEVSIKSGIRAQVADWDTVTDLLLLKDSPSILSVGHRCRNGKFTYIHVEGRKYSCFVSSAENSVIIFPLKLNVPVYCRRWERERTDAKPCGAYSLSDNKFRELLGVWVNSVGQLVVDGPDLAGFVLGHDYSDDPTLAVAGGGYASAVFIVWPFASTTVRKTTFQRDPDNSTRIEDQHGP